MYYPVKRDLETRDDRESHGYYHFEGKLWVEDRPENLASKKDDCKGHIEGEYRPEELLASDVGKHDVASLRNERSGNR